MIDNKKKKKGVTLLEIVMSIGLLAIVSIPITQTLMTAVKINKQGQDKQRATLIGQEILEEIRAKDFENDGLTLSNGIKIEKINDNKYSTDSTVVNSIDGFDIAINMEEDLEINFKEDLNPINYDGILYVKSGMSNNEIIVSKNIEFTDTDTEIVQGDKLKINNSLNQISIGSSSKIIYYKVDTIDSLDSLKIIFTDQKSIDNVKIAVNNMASNNIMNVYLSGEDKITGNDLDTQNIIPESLEGTMRVYKNYKDNIDEDEKMGSVFEIDIAIKKKDKLLFEGNGIKNLVND